MKREFQVICNRGHTTIGDRNIVKCATCGDTMRNYGVRKTSIDTYSDGTIEVWELYRKRPVKHGLKTSAYFRLDTFEQTFKKR